MARRVLILGGTMEARNLAAHLAGRADLDVTVSLAGRTADIVEHPVPLRLGGFGGAAGLADYLREHRIDVLIDATHPYAGFISRNATEAAAIAGVPLLALARPPWATVSGDRWREVADVDEVIDALGPTPRRVFLTLGRRLIAPFAAAPQHFYLIRSIDPVDPRLSVPDAVYVAERGPFTEAADHALMQAHRIDAVVARNSGGSAAYAKIAAARALGIEVMLLRRPPATGAQTVATIAEAVAWLDHEVTVAAARGV